MVILWMAAPALAGSKGEKILSDPEFFTKEYHDVFTKALKVVAGPMRKAGGGATTFTLTVPEPRPEIGAIQKKYGKPSRVTTEEIQDVPRPSHTARVYYYGSIGFAVAVDDGSGKVGWLVAR
jgi:hypothetical protein